MAVLHCISISELCSVINSTVATVHETFTSRNNKFVRMQHMQFIAWNKQKIWKPISIKSQLHYHHATYYSCSYVVNSIHEYFVKTDLHLQISQHQARLKHKTSLYHITATPHYCRKTFCSYSYILVVYFTASTIWGLQKLGLVGMWATTTCS